MKAKERGVYDSLEKVDLLKKLPCSDNSVDYLTCIGTTTYLEPKVIHDWLRVVKPGGYISFTHKTIIWPKWETLQENFQKCGKWKHIWTSKELFYLPSCSGEDISSRVKVYIYQK